MSGERVPDSAEAYGFNELFPESYMAVRVTENAKDGILIASGESKEAVMKVVEEDKASDSGARYYHVFGPRGGSTDTRIGWVVMTRKD